MPHRSALRAKDSETLGSEERYRAIVDTAVDAIVVIDEIGLIRAFNPAAERLFGYAADDVAGQNVKVLMPEPYHTGHDEYLGRYRRTGERRIIGIGREVSGLRKDGSTFPLELSIAEWRSSGQRFFTGVMRDVSERKRAEERQRLLVNELNHRVKNSLATVQALASQTLRNADTVEGARSALTARLLALSMAHDILTREDWGGAPLADVIRAAVVHNGEQGRFTIGGPDVRLTPQMALALSMALHELSTNAVKYGALSNETGFVEITWQVNRNGSKRLELRWEEHGGPPVAAPTRRGFGTRMIEDGLTRDLEGSAHMDFQPWGLTCTITARLREMPSAAKEH